MSFARKREFELINSLGATLEGFFVNNPTAVRAAQGLVANSHRGGASDSCRPATFPTGLVVLPKRVFAFRASLLTKVPQQA